MGKFMEKSKAAREVPLLEISSHSNVTLGGVRTRAKTLALRRLGRSSRNPSSPSSSSSSSSACYLELRSRRLPKPQHLPAKPRNRPRKQGSGESPNFQLIPEVGKGRTSRRSSRSIGGSGSVLPSFEEMQSGGCHGHFCDSDSGQGSEGGTEPAASVGSSSGGERSRSDQQRERRAASLAARRQLVGGGAVVSGVPSADEIEEFFVFAEREQQRVFIEKYNFDVLSDAPLLGRFEWVLLRP